MKKIILTVVLFCTLLIDTKAQNNQPIIYSLQDQTDLKKPETNSKKELSFGPELGLNLSNMPINDSGTKAQTSIKPGLVVGGIADIGITDNIYLQPGLFYLMNGCKVTGGSLNLNSIQLPVNVEYKLGKRGKNRIFFGLGLYVAYNISASVKAGGTSTTLKIGSDATTADIKPIDFGAGVNAGYQLSKGLFVRAHYQMGFANLLPGGNATNSIKTNAISISVGYLFKAGK